MFAGRQSTDPSPALDVSSEDAAIAGVVARLSAEYALRAYQLLIEQYGDICAGLIAQMINTANTTHPDLPSEGARRVAGADGLVPDEARRPIGLSRLAECTGLPYETARQIVQRLIDQGACVRVDGGVMAPMAAMARPQATRAALINAGYVRRLARDLAAAGMAPTPALAAQDDLAITRLVARRSALYLLRATGRLAETYGDARTGVLVQTITVANTGYLDTRNGEGRRYAGLAQTLPDALRRPISGARLLQSLGSPFTRRHVQRLIDDGLCVRVPGGLIVPGAVLETPAAAHAALANVDAVRRFMSDLISIGF